MHGVCTQESIVPLYYYVYFPPSGYVGEDAFHLISVMCRSQVSFTSIFYSQFTIDINLQVNSNKFIVKPPTESYVIYSGYFLPIYVKLPYKTLHLRVLLVAGGRTCGRPRMRLSPLPFSFHVVVPVNPAAFLQHSKGDEPNFSSNPWIFVLASSSHCNPWRVLASSSIFTPSTFFEQVLPPLKVTTILI